MDERIEMTQTALQAERSISKKYRKVLWGPFVAGIKQYKLIEPGDRIGVCISGGKDSMLMAKMLQMLQRYSEFPFELEYIVMDPGYNEENRALLCENAKALGLPIQIKETNIFTVAFETEKNPCYLCARMRRGHLYSIARSLGCSKIALGHHMNDVIETTVMSMLYGSQLQGMMPKLRSSNFPGMELIRPLYRVREKDIISWSRYNGLRFLQCACRFTEGTDNDRESRSKRLLVKNLIARLMEDNKYVEDSIFSSIHNVNVDTFPGRVKHGERIEFSEIFEENGYEDEKKEES